MQELPIVVGGDSNMQDHEGKSDFLCDVYKKSTNILPYVTWPNKTSSDRYKYTSSYRFDRFWYKNIDVANYNTINTEQSDHYMIACNLQFKP